MAAPSNTLTGDQAFAHALQATALGSLSVPELHVCNLAGQQLASMHAWRCFTTAQGWIDGRGNIDIVNATYTESTKNLLKTGGFTNYTFVDGDQIDITGGANAQKRQVEIVSRTDANNIVLLDSLGAAADGDTDVDGTLHLPKCELAPDFGSIITMSANNTLINGVQLVTPGQVLAFRTNQIEVTSAWQYHATIIYVGRPRRPVLDVYPDFGSDQINVFRYFYRQGWTRLAKLGDIVEIPDFLWLLYIQLVRAFALGWEDEDQRTVTNRLEEIKQGQEFEAARMFDWRVQPSFGRMRGGAVRRVGRQYPNALSTEVAGPS